MIDYSKKIKTSNLTESEIDALEKLKSRDDIVIKPADKGGRVVVWNKDHYIEEGLSQLENNEAFYRKMARDPTKEFNKVIINAVKEEIGNERLPDNAFQLFSNHPRTFVFYMLPKIHKPSNPGRPIVSAVSCPSSQIATFLDSILAPIVHSLPTFVKDSPDALRIFDQFRFTGENRFLFTMDVKSLYTVIPNADGLSALKHFLDQRTNKDPPTSTLLRLAELVLTTNGFSFDQQFYVQVGGVAMGSKLGPSYACLFVGYQEYLISQQYEGPIPHLIKRYIDDVVGATSLPREQLQAFIDFVSNFRPALKFTVEITETSIPFLDITLSINGNLISTSVHYKETDAHRYLLYSSSHPVKCEKSIPFSQLLRLNRLCSNKPDFADKAKEMCQFFMDSGCPKSIIEDALERISRVSRQQALQAKPNKTSEDRIPLTLTYHPLSLPIKRIIYRNFDILQTNKDTKTIFTKRPLMAFRRDSNLRDILVHSKLKKREDNSGKHPRCRTCNHVSQLPTSHNLGNSFTVHKRYTYSFTCLIYAIKC